jgi:molecular chaperone DnaK
MEALGSKSQQLAQAIYQGSATQGAAAGDDAGPAGDPDEEVVDAEVVDEGEDEQPAG